eukprot:489158-Pyramimonas_sp.AAC.1
MVAHRNRVKHAVPNDSKLACSLIHSPRSTLRGGERVDAKGGGGSGVSEANMDAKGYMVDVTGYNMDAKG